MAAEILHRYIDVSLSMSIMLFLRPLPILGMGMVVLGSVLLLLLLTVRHKVKVDPLFYGTIWQNTHFDIYWCSERLRCSCRFVFHCALMCSFSVCRVFLHLHGGPD